MATVALAALVTFVVIDGLTTSLEIGVTDFSIGVTERAVKPLSLDNHNLFSKSDMPTVSFIIGLVEATTGTSTTTGTVTTAAQILAAVATARHLAMEITSVSLVILMGIQSLLNCWWQLYQ